MISDDVTLWMRWEWHWLGNNDSNKSSELKFGVLVARYRRCHTRNLSHFKL